MTSAARSLTTDGRRGRGKRAGLDLAKIVKAAGMFSSETLTLQAVADVLGVNRKALSYYVPDRQSLLALVAEGALSESLEAVTIAPALCWQEACLALAEGMADSLIAAGDHADYLRVSGPSRRLLAPVDDVMGKLIAAGFDNEEAARTVALLANIATGFARDTMIASRDRDNPLSVQLKQAARTAGDKTLANIERAAVSPVRTYDRQQLKFSVDLIVRGLEALGKNASSDGRRV